MFALNKSEYRQLSGKQPERQTNKSALTHPEIASELIGIIKVHMLRIFTVP